MLLILVKSREDKAAQLLLEAMTSNYSIIKFKQAFQQRLKRCVGICWLIQFETEKEALRAMSKIGSIQEENLQGFSLFVEPASIDMNVFEIN